ncbi:hypothetical protein SHI21_03050 [Bacteriovorax sp. PP10]|uniref:Uncharacterized protein n=1 Tax=Bacteriovorax antarcticus TaxID=3088717 RepID=A0ABU5VQ37_9BACT|nr:hypothetical protein [Bacteriovorax sp. PP10]MEA9355158.1 hypothetical protein [Bacteriovorax sp. PP10]
MKLLIVTALLIITQSAFALEIKGTRAEALYNQIAGLSEELGDIGGLDCAMGTCYASIPNTKCVKAFVEETDREGYRTSCTFVSPEGKSVTVKNDDNGHIGSLRRTLIDLTGKLVTENDSNSIKVKSVDCKGTSLGRDADGLEIEQTFTCSIK